MQNQAPYVELVPGYLGFEKHDTENIVTFYFGDCDLILTSNNNLLYTFNQGINTTFMKVHTNTKDGFISSGTINLSGKTQFTGYVSSTAFFLQLDEESALPKTSAVINLYITGPSQDKMASALHEVYIKNNTLPPTQQTIVYCNLAEGSPCGYPLQINKITNLDTMLEYGKNRSGGTFICYCYHVNDMIEKTTLKSDILRPASKKSLLTKKFGSQCEKFIFFDMHTLKNRKQVETLILRKLQSTSTVDISFFGNTINLNKFIAILGMQLSPDFK